MAKRILLIDDEERLSEVVQTCLETLGGWEVLTAQDGSFGLQIAQTQPLDAILLDVMLPEMDGVTLFNHLKSNERTKEIPVILLTAKTQDWVQSEFSQLAVAGIIFKPFDPLKLADRVAEILGWSI